MAKVTISIEGTTDEIAEYLNKLAGVKVKEQATDVSWLPEEIETLYTDIQSEAKRICREVANNPEGYDRDALIAKLRITGRGLAGRLSSVEFTRRRLFPSKPKPIELNWETWKYEMLPEVAEWIRGNTTV